MATVKWDVDYSQVVKNEELGCSIRVRIPFEKKDEFAREYASRVLTLEDNGFAGENMYHNVIQTYLFVKYYTDVEIDDSVPIEAVYEWAVANKALEIISDVADKDYYETYDLAINCSNYTIDVWKRRHSLESLATGMFDDQIMQTLAENKIINEEMLNLLHNRNAENSKEAKPKKNNLLNFAKKNV